MAKKKTNRKGEIKMTNEEIKNTEEVVNDTIETAASNEGEEDTNNETETTEVIVNNNEAVTEPVKETEDPEVKPEVIVHNIIEGMVEGCARLNVRKEASKTADIVYTINKGDLVIVDLTNSTYDFYKVVAPNFEGYCVKDFIEIK